MHGSLGYHCRKINFLTLTWVIFFPVTFTLSGTTKENILLIHYRVKFKAQKHNILLWNICFRACAYFSMDVLCSSLFGHHVTSHKNPGEDFVKKVLEAFEAGNKTIIKPVTLCGKIFLMIGI